jgi:hypothetical protein
MRRLAFIFLAFSALAVPAAALAAATTAGDGTLVVKNGTAPDSGPDKVPVVRMKITGSVIGQLTGQGRIIIDAGAKLAPTVEVTGAAGPSSVPQSDTAKLWVGDANGFKFRAVGGTFTIVIFGAGVNLVAVGTGTVTLAGTPGSATDGRYSLNGDDFKPLLAAPTARLSIGSDG